MPEGLSGNLARLPLWDLLRMLHATGQTGRVEFASVHERAEMFLDGGRLVHAAAGASSGDAAFAIVLGWTQATFRFEPGGTTGEATILKPLDQLFAEGARQVSERERLREAIPSPDAVPTLSLKLDLEDVTISAGDWEVLARIDGDRSVAELSRTLGWPDLETVRALYRLKEAGLITLKAEPAAPVPIAMAGPAFFAALQSAVAAAMGPLAEIIVDDTLEELGFTRGTLPRAATSAVTERISREIRDAGKRVRFQETMLETLRAQAA
ncbi:MAG: hypothetical protein C0506_09145 [Anaerolinea sp.]|nr:hypothetical protein [Anaerolinea sp.]